jgi:uncharacterized RDD family membrane protein YckC
VTQPVFINPAPVATSNEQFELAGWGARFGAYIVDMLVRLVVAVAVPLIAFVVFADDPFSWAAFADADSDELFEPGADFGDSNLFWIGVTALLIYYASALIYAPLFMARWRGATPGKRLFGIRVVGEGGADLSFGQSFLREPICKGLVVNTIGGTLALPSLISYLWPLWDRECRAGHDFMARSRVVRAPR